MHAAATVEPLAGAGSSVCAFVHQTGEMTDFEKQLAIIKDLVESRQDQSGVWRSKFASEEAEACIEKLRNFVASANNASHGSSRLSRCISQIRNLDKVIAVFDKEKTFEKTKVFAMIYSLLKQLGFDVNPDSSSVARPVPAASVSRAREATPPTPEPARAPALTVHRRVCSESDLPVELTQEINPLPGKALCLDLNGPLPSVAQSSEMTSYLRELQRSLRAIKEEITQKEALIAALHDSSNPLVEEELAAFIQKLDSLQSERIKHKLSLKYNPHEFYLRESARNGTEGQYFFCRLTPISKGGRNIFFVDQIVLDKDGCEIQRKAWMRAPLDFKKTSKTKPYTTVSFDISGYTNDSLVERYNEHHNLNMFTF